MTRLCPRSVARLASLFASCRVGARFARVRGPRRSAPALALFALLLAVLLPGQARAAPFDLNDGTWEGCADLLTLARQELGSDRVIVLSTLDWEQIKASDGILVLHPSNPMDAEESAAFMKAGGRMAILDDYGRGDKLLAHFKIKRRTLPGDPAAYLRGKPALPIATPAVDASEGEVLGLHPTVAEVKQVVLNHGTGLRHPNLTPVLEVRIRGQEAVPVAVAGQIEGEDNKKGRLFAMGDPSAFINLMLRYPGNRAFAVGLVRYLADGDATEPRHGRLFVIANEFEEKSSFGGVTPLRKTIDRKIEAFLDTFTDLRDHGFPWWLHVAVASIFALLVLWWVQKSLVRLYRTRLPRFARSVPLVQQGGVAGRVAVLSSEVSPPALALLEVRSALVEALAYHLHVSEALPPAQLIGRIRDEGRIDDSLDQEAQAVLASMRAAENAVVAGGQAKISEAEVRRAAAFTERLLEKVGVDIPWPPTFSPGRERKPPA
jgi:hypothetical protein